MAFSSSVKLAALQRAAGRCECTHPHHDHAGRCSERVTIASAQFQRPTRRFRPGFDGVVNCEVRCARCGAPVVS
jgi:hypothetical protein